MRARTMKSSSSSETSSEALPPPPVLTRFKPFRYYHDYIPIGVIFTAVFGVVSIGVYQFLSLFPFAVILWALFHATQVILNIVALRLSMPKDSVHHQLRRLEINNIEQLSKQTLPKLRCKEKTLSSTKYCQPCERHVPVRSVHCKYCATCTLRNDHHCYAVGTCLGIVSLRYFTMMGVHLFFLGMTGLYIFSTHYMRETIEGDWWDQLKARGGVFVQMMGVHAMGMNAIRWAAEGKVLTVDHALNGVVYLGSLIAFCSGAFIAIYQMYLTAVKGLGMLEYSIMDEYFKGDGGTLLDRIRLVYGSRWYLNFFFPRWWNDVEWTEEMVDNVLINPLKHETKEHYI